VQRRGAFTIIEVLVCTLVIGLLVALGLSAVQFARESARRAYCSSNLRQLGLAMSAHESVHGYLPPGNFNRGFSQHVAMLPYLEQGDLHRQLDLRGPANASSVHQRNRLVQSVSVPVFGCPTDVASLRWVPPDGTVIVASSYAANFGTGVQKYGYNGMFRNKKRYGTIATADVKDGLAYTAAMSEVLVSNGTPAFLRVNWNTPQSFAESQELERFAIYCSAQALELEEGDMWSRGRPWTHGTPGVTWYNHVLTPNQPSCFNGTLVQEGAFTSASLHNTGVNVLFADARAMLVTSTVTLSVWREFGSRDGATIFR
jgi:prepilin-type processing-associated H-X9-DG protein